MCFYLYGKSENGSSDYFVLLDFNVTKAGRGMDLYFLNHSLTCHVFQDTFFFSLLSDNIIYFVYIGYKFGLFYGFFLFNKIEQVLYAISQLWTLFWEKENKQKQTKHKT